MDTQTLAAALAIIAASTVGIIEAASPYLPVKSKPLASIVVGAVLAVGYIALPTAYQPLMLVVLAGATGTATVAVAKRIGGQPADTGA